MLERNKFGQLQCLPANVEHKSKRKTYPAKIQAKEKKTEVE